MGKATITANIGAGLYKAIPLINHGRIDFELSQLLAAQAAYLGKLAAAYRAQSLVDAEKVQAGQALSAVIEQWKAALIDKATLIPPLPPPTETDPDTGEVWVDPDRAQDAPLFDAINAARVAAGVPPLLRDNRLDTAARKFLRYQGHTGRIGSIDETGLKPENRIAVEAYPASAVEELLSYGDMTPDAVVAGWLKSPEMRAKLLDPAFTDCGVSYHYSPQHFAGQLWALELVTPGEPPATVTMPQDDPVTTRSEDITATLERIEKPTINNLAPKQLGEAASKFALAANKARLAEQEITRLQAEKIARNQRITVLQAIKDANVALDVWCYVMDEDIKVGTVVDTVEIPGFWREEGTPRTATLWKWDDTKKRTVGYTERSWNIAPGGKEPESAGQLTRAEGMGDAAVFVNAALEPGHLKWRPRWRYGMLTAMSVVGEATVALNAIDARLFDGESQLVITAAVGLSCGCRYLDCNADAFLNNQGVLIPDQEVLVAYTGANRGTSAVVGFRREPLPCPSGRVSWNGVSF